MKKSIDKDTKELILDIQDIENAVSKADLRLKCRLVLNEVIAFLELDGPEEVVPLGLTELPGAIKENVPKDVTKALKTYMHFANEKSGDGEKVSDEDLKKVSSSSNELIAWLSGEKK